MTRIGITGATGFIGVHAHFFLSQLEKTGEVKTVIIPRTAFADTGVLVELVSSCDAIMHFAGTKWGDDAEMYRANIELAQKIVDACRVASVRPHILFASSIHAEGQTVFGKSKKEASHLFLAWAAESGARVAIFPLPHIFGEFARPFHNSAVATLCHQLVNGESSEVREDAVVELMYVGEVAALFYRAIIEGREGQIRAQGTHRTLPDVYALLKDFSEDYSRGRVPSVAGTLDTALLLTFHWHWLLHNTKHFNIAP